MKILKVALIVVVLIIIILAISGTNIFGAVLVSDISLEKRGDSTWVTIMATNPFEFSSSSVPAKEGRPFRILIDCKDALHNLPQYDYRQLPSGIVTSIRTSQYQTDPNRVVRIVLDVAKTVNYEINPADKTLVITLVSMGEPDFERWSASGVTAPVTPSVEKTESASAEQPVTTTTPETATTSISEPPTTETAETPVTSEASSTAEPTEPTQPTTASTEPETPIETTSTEPIATEPISPQPSSTYTATPAPETVVSSDAQPTSVPSEVAQPTEAADTTAPVAEVTPTEDTVTAETETAPPPTPTEPTLKTMVKKEPKKTLVPEQESEEIDESKAEVKVTPPTAITEEEGAPIVKVTPSQIQEKALQAIETFPKRKMIQYRSLGKRDPFSPLIGDKKVTEFGQAPIPSIENLKLVGVLQDFQGNKALLEDNRGYGYIMEPGDRVKNGTVILVDEDRVIFQIQEYGWSRNVALDLYNIENK